MKLATACLSGRFGLPVAATGAADGAGALVLARNVCGAG